MFLRRERALSSFSVDVSSKEYLITKVTPKILNVS